MHDSDAHHLPRLPSFVKWLIFGVSLPLLPIGSRVLAQWIDGTAIDLTPQGLFGDGELLVIATVVSAAGIGDLVFDIRRSSRRGTLFDAGVASFALICVIFSVLLYGLVTLRKESASPAQTTASAQVQVKESQVRFLEEQRTIAAKELTSVQGLYTEQLKRDPGGKSPLTRALLSRVLDATNRLQAADTDLRRGHDELIGVQEQVAQVTNEVNDNTTQTAIASLIMFSASLIAGSLCIVSVTRISVSPDPGEMPDDIVAVTVPPNGNSPGSARKAVADLPDTTA